MTVGSKAFFLFLLCVLVGYHVLRGRSAKFRFLLVASWVFYAACSPRYLWVLLLLTTVDFLIGKRIEAEVDETRRRRWLIASIVSNLGLLFAFKYTPFVWDIATDVVQLFGGAISERTWNILLPLGISFHTFQGISYTVDVYRRQIRAVASFRDYALFVAFFPQMAAGPIVRAVEFLPQLLVPPVPTTDQIRDGTYLFIRGLFKKLVIADHLDQLFVTAVFDDPASYSSVACRWAILAWAVQIYCDFSGYTDMALGIAKWFGFELPGNFHLPYLATSITDFWRRWHLSLSTWLRDYLYFPLGGSKGSALRTYFNLMVLFVLCGLWHGATWAWLVYGVYNGVLMSVHRMMGQPGRWRSSSAWAAVAWAATFLQLLLGLILVRMTSWENGSTMLAGIFGFSGGTSPVPALVPLLVVMGLAGHLWELIRVRLPSVSWNWEPVRALGAAAAIAGAVVFSPGAVKSFIYIQF